MPETGIALKDYILPVVVILEVIFFAISGIFAVMSFIALARSKSRKCKNRVEMLNWNLKSIGYSKKWLLFYIICCVLGVVAGFTVGDKMLFYTYFLMVIIFSVFFIAVKQTYKFISKEFKNAKAILDD